MKEQEALEILEHLQTFRNDEVYLDDKDIEAIALGASALRSEIMECEAGAEQKAWEEKRARYCEDCKYEHRSLFDEPCCRCDAETLDLWEEKENETSE